MKVFLDEIIIWTGDSVDYTFKCGWALSNLLKAQREQKAEKGGIHHFCPCLPVWNGASVFYFWIGTYIISSPGSQAFILGLEWHHQLPQGSFGQGSW